MPLGRKDDLSFDKDLDSLTIEQVYLSQGRKFKPQNKRNPRWIKDDPFKGTEPPRPPNKKK